MTEGRRWSDRLRVPAHVVVLLGASTAAYAVMLAGITADQSRADAVVAAQRAPVLAGLEALTKGHDELLDRVGRAQAEYDTTAAAYETAGQRIVTFEAQLATLATGVAQIDGVSRTLPTKIALPPVRSIGSVSVPATHSTTGASGG